MDAIGRFVADAVLGIDTLWGGDVMCPSGTGRFIADSWFSDEPLPAAYKVPAAARLRASGGVAGKKVDGQAVEEYLGEVDLPQAIAGVRDESVAQTYSLGLRLLRQSAEERCRMGMHQAPRKNQPPPSPLAASA
jgi:hypothetical protein